jgi:hypothetical protein
MQENEVPMTDKEVFLQKQCFGDILFFRVRVYSIFDKILVLKLIN